MDFIVSKVMMSICALTVVSILGGLVGPDIFTHPEAELSGILKSFHACVRSTAHSGPGSRITWAVPTLTDGSSVAMSIHTNIVRCASDGEQRASSSDIDLHLWTWDGEPLNDTRMAWLDGEAPVVMAKSGEMLVIACERVLVENDLRNLEFISLAI